MKVDELKIGHWYGFIGFKGNVVDHCKYTSYGPGGVELRYTFCSLTGYEVSHSAEVIEKAMVVYSRSFSKFLDLFCGG